MAKEKKRVYRDRYLRKQVSVLNPKPLEKSFGNFLRIKVRETYECRDFTELECLRSLENLKIHKVRGK